MRINLTCTKSKELININYQEHLVSKIQQWMGKDNAAHHALSLYSFSWLKGSQLIHSDKIAFERGATWHISVHDEDLYKCIIAGIQQDTYLFGGMEVAEIVIQQNPELNTKARFSLASPVFIKRTIDRRQQYYFWNDKESNALMTETLMHKMRIANISDEGVKVYFDEAYNNPKTKKITYKGVDCKANMCPVIVEGTAEQLQFAWNVGIGSSTGIGFGALV